VADREPSSSPPKTISVDTLKLGTRSECPCVVPTVAPRAPSVSYTGTATVGDLIASSRSASSRQVPLGASALPALA
jgi:hypothetical protein